jgi:hypothetical protein
MSKIVALIADEEQGQKPSIRQRRLLTGLDCARLNV